MKEYNGEDIRKAINDRQNKVINSISKSFIQNEDAAATSNNEEKPEPTEEQVEEQKAKDLDNERRGKE